MQKWQFGETYQLADYVGFIAADRDGNSKIYRKIGYSEFKVIDIDTTGRVVQIVVGDDYSTASDLELAFFFKEEELQYFKLADSSQDTKPSSDEVVIEWLNKLKYVFDNEFTMLNFDYSTMIVETDFGDVRGAKEIVEFINNNYEMLKINENTQKKTELEAKREQLLAELAEIDKQLNIK